MMPDANTLATLLIGVCIGAGIAIAAGAFASADRLRGRIEQKIEELEQE